MSIEQLESFAAKLEQSKAELQKFAQEQGGAIIGAAFAELLKKYPEVKRVSWKQYTPYFNDGDACTFSVRALCLVPETDEDDDDYEYELWGEYPEFLSDGARKEFTDLWDRVSDEDVMLAIFGDHTQVKITREGVEVDEYDHD